MRLKSLILTLVLILPTFAYSWSRRAEKFFPKIQQQVHFSGIESIDCIYVINLIERKDKLKRMKMLLTNNNIDFIHVKGTNGWYIPKFEYRRLIGKKTYDKEMNPGKLGCALSHFSVWKHAIDQKYKIVWIMEDDIEFVENPKNLDEIIEQISTIDSDWDILYTDPNSCDWSGNYTTCPCPNCNHPKSKKKSSHYFLRREPAGKNFERIYSRYGTYSMIISEKGLRKLFDYHAKIEIWSSIDTTIHHVPELRQYAIKNPIATHTFSDRVSDTDKNNF